MMVTTIPKLTSCKRPSQESPGSCSGVIRSWTPVMANCRVLMPTKIRPNPAIVIPNFEYFPLAKSFRLAPIKMSGNTAVSSCSLKPRMATSQPVTVVPKFAPKIMPRALENFNKPALTNPTVATVVALEDCNRAVVEAPVIAPDSGF